jgi:hypothetical protein
VGFGARFTVFFKKKKNVNIACFGGNGGILQLASQNQRQVVYDPEAASWTALIEIVGS